MRHFVGNNAEVFYEKRKWKYTWRMWEMDWLERREGIMGELQWTSQESNSNKENSCGDFDVVGTCS